MSDYLVFHNSTIITTTTTTTIKVLSKFYIPAIDGDMSLTTHSTCLFELASVLHFLRAEKNISICRYGILLPIYWSKSSAPRKCVTQSFPFLLIYGIQCKIEKKYCLSGNNVKNCYSVIWAFSGLKKNLFLQKSTRTLGADRQT